MKYTINIFVLVLITVLLSSCDKKNPEEKIIANYDCEFIQVDGDNDGLLDEEENQLIQDCLDGAYDSTEEIKDNLIGEWILVGHAQGWVVDFSQPCAYIIFEEDELTFKFENGTIDTILTAEYEIQENQSPSWVSFRLDVGDLYIDGLELNNFSPQYMFGSSAALDGNTYIYEKMK